MSVVFERGADGKVVQRNGDGVAIEHDPQSWGLFRKHALTRAVQIPGPFTVETSEGPLKCADGHLAVDARGYPYPIAADEFAQIYSPADAPDDVGGAVADFLRDQDPSGTTATQAARAFVAHLQERGLKIGPL